jgi:hypothetical protein
MAHFDAPDVVRAVVLGQTPAGTDTSTQTIATRIGIA